MSIFDNFTPGPKYLEWNQSEAPKAEFKQQYSYGDRGFFSEMFSNFYRGLGSSVELTGRGLQQFGAEKAGGMLQGYGESMLEHETALPDYDEYTRDPTKFSAQGVANTTAQVLSSMVGILAAGAAGTAVAGPLGGKAAALGFMTTSFGAGTYHSEKEEYWRQHQDGNEEDAHMYGLKQGAAELMYEIIGTGTAYLGGKYWLTPALKAGTKSLVNSGEYTVEQILASTFKTPSGKKALAAMILGTEGGSEVLTEVTQRANAVEYDMDRGEPTNLMNLFVGSLIPGAAMGGVGAYSQSQVNKRMQGVIEESLQSESQAVRVAMVNNLATRLESVEEGAGEAFRKDIEPLAIKGPLSLDKHLQDMQKESEVDSTIINEPEKVLEEAGIPAHSPYHSPLRTEKAADPPAPPPIITHPAPPADPSVEAGVQRELEQREQLEKEIAERAEEVAGDLSRSTIVTEAITAGRISDPELVSAYQEFQVWNLNERRKRAIDKGMEKLSEDSNTLDTLDDLDARADVLKRMTKVSAQIKREIKAARAAGVRKGDIPSVPGDTQIPSREKTKEGGKSTEVLPTASLPVQESAIPTQSPVVPVETQAVVEDITADIATSPTVPLSSTIETTGTLAPVPPVNAGAVPGKASVEKSGSTTVAKRWKVTDTDGLEYAAETKKEANAAVRDGKISSLRPFSLSHRLEGKGKKKTPLTPEQRVVAEAFYDENFKEFQASDHDFLGEAVSNLLATGEGKLTLGTVKEEVKRLRKVEGGTSIPGKVSLGEPTENMVHHTTTDVAHETGGANKNLLLQNKKAPAAHHTPDNLYRTRTYAEKDGVPKVQIYREGKKVGEPVADLAEASVEIGKHRERVEVKELTTKSTASKTPNVVRKRTAAEVAQLKADREAYEAQQKAEADAQLAEEKAKADVLAAQVAEAMKPVVSIIPEKDFSGNKAFTQEAVDKAKKAIKDSTKKLSSGFDPMLFKHLVVIGGAHFERGVRDFAKWIAATSQELGQVISEKYLKDSFDLISNHPIFWGEGRKKGALHDYEPTMDKNGKYHGAPEWVKGPKELAQMRRLLNSRLKEGVVGRSWYEQSAQAVMKLVGNDPVKAEKFIQLLAIYSPQAKVDVNTTFALRAWDQYNKGVSRKDFKVKTGDQDSKAIGVLYDNVPFNGRKTSSFYANLVTDILNKNPWSLVDMQIDADTLREIKKIATVDLWMYRAFGYKRESAGDDKGKGAYSFAEREVGRLQDRLNAKREKGEPEWTAYQVQAAIWTAMKARYEDPGVKDKTWEISIKRGWGKKGRILPTEKEAKEKHAYLWMVQSQQISSEQATKNAEEWAADFDTFLTQNTRVVTWETNPSSSLGHNVPESLKDLFNAEAAEIIFDENGVDLLAEKLGISMNFIKRGSGVFKGEINTNNLSHLAYGKVKAGGFNHDLARAYARAIQFIFKQDAVPWFRPEPRALLTKDSRTAQLWRVVRDHNGTTASTHTTLAEAEAAVKKGQSVKGGNLSRGILLTFPTNLSREQEVAFKNRMLEVMGEDSSYTKMGPDEISLINYRRDTGVPFKQDELFEQQVQELATEFQVEQNGFYAESEYGHDQNWRKDEAGEKVLTEGGTSFPQDIQNWLRDRQREYDSVLERYDTGPDRGVVEFWAGRSGTVPNGHTGLTHWGKEGGLKELDPSFHGKGIAGAESRRKKNDPANWVDRTYYAVEGGTYVKEANLGPNEYKTSIPTYKLYDITKDPDGFVEAAREERKGDPFAEEVNIWERMIKDAGYVGYTSPTMGGVAAVFQKQTVSMEVQGVQEELNRIHASVTFMVMQLKREHKTAQLAKVALLNMESRTQVQEVALMELTAEVNNMRTFSSALDLFESLEGEAMSPRQRELWQWVKDNIDLKRLEGVGVVTGAKRNAYIAKDNAITLVASAASSSKIHEIMHALTSAAVHGDSKATRALTKIREAAQKEAVEKGLLTQEQVDRLQGINTSADFKAIHDLYSEKQRIIAYGLMNNGEFISEIFGDKGFREFATRLGEGDKSLLKRFVSFVKELLGFKNESVFEQILSLTAELSDTPWTGKGDMQMELKRERKSPPESRQEAREIIKAGSRKTRAGQRLLDAQTFAEDYLRPVSDRIRVMSQKLFGRLTQYEAEMIIHRKRYGDQVKPFMAWFGKLGKEAQVALDLALMNSELKKNQEYIDKTIPANIKKGLDAALTDLNQRMLDVGMGGSKDRPYYFPRRVKDMPRLIDALYPGGMLERAFEQEKVRLGKPVLTEAEKSEVVTKMFTMGRPTTLPRPGASKQRTVPWVDKDTYAYYHNSPDSLLGHIFEMNEKLGAMEFVGRSDRKQRVAALRKEADKLEDMKDGPERDQLLQEYIKKAEELENTEQYLAESTSSLVAEEMEGKTTAQQKQMVDLINARLRQKGAHGFWGGLRDIGYITTMGNFLSAITQLGDIPIIFYSYGFNPGTIGAVLKAFHNIARLTYADMRGKPQPKDVMVIQADFTNALREFANGDTKTGKLVEMAFKYSGLKYVDLIGKEAHLQAAQRMYAKDKNKQKFMQRYEPLFGKESAQVLADIKSGKKTNDTLTVLLAELSDWQPIFLSTQSKKYMEAGNGRLFYMLKTFTLRATSAALREGAVHINKGGAVNMAKGMGKITGIILLYALAGAGTDELKNLLRGRDEDFLDSTMDNFMQMFFLNRFALEKGLQGDSLGTTFINTFAPPFRYLDGFGADLWALADDDKEFKFKTLQSTPMLGTIAYGRSEAGQTSFANTMKKDILEEVRKNKAKGKPPYTGDVKDAVKKHNEKVTRDKWINHDTIMRAYKNV